MKANELLQSAGMKFVVQHLDNAMQNHGVSEDTRGRVLEIFQMMVEYFPYAAAQKKNPADAKILAQFLLSKGKHMGKLFNNEELNCGLAILDFALSVRTAAIATSTGFVPVMGLSYALALVDLIDVGNKCSMVQKATYKLAYESAQVQLAPIRAQSAGMCVAR